MSDLMHGEKPRKASQKDDARPPGSEQKRPTGRRPSVHAHPSAPPVETPPAPVAQPPAAVPQPAPQTVYSATPAAIYKAAEQLEIPIPQNRDLLLKNTRESLARVLATAANPVANKNGLWETVWHIAGDMTTAVALHSDLDQSLYPLDESDNRIVSHCLNSAVIAIGLAKQIPKAEYSAQDIAAAALVHDFGLAPLGLAVEWDEDDPVYRTHVAEGVVMLKAMKAPQSALTMVEQHHERTDGNGYPAGIRGSSMLISSQVLALGEAFERILGESLAARGKQNVSQKNYVQATIERFRLGLDSDVLKGFISLRGFYPNGTIVELTNRTLALVIKQNDGFPLRPVVQIVLDNAGNHPARSKLVDLRSAPALAILRSVTQDGSDR